MSDQEEDIILSELDDEELREQMWDDLYDGLAEEVVEGTEIFLARGWSASRVLDDALVGTWQFEATQEHAPWSVTIYRFNNLEYLLMFRQGDAETELLRGFVSPIEDEKFLNIQDIRVSESKKTWMFANYSVTKDEL